MKTLDVASVPAADLHRLEDTVKAMEEDSPLAFFLASVAAAVRHGDDVIAGKPSDLVTPSHAARLLGISRAHLYKVMDAGELPFVHVGRDRRVALSDVRVLLAERDSASRDLAERFARMSETRDQAGKFFDA